MKFNPFSPIEVSGSFTVPDDQVTQLFGETSDIAQKFTLTIPLPTNCIVRDGEVYYGEQKIGKVNESDASRVNLFDMELEDFVVDENGITVTFRQV